MSSEERNPNQGFENYAKEFSLRIELIRAVGEYEKNIAEAQLTKAKALDQLEKTRTTSLINSSLARALRNIEIAERKAEAELKKVNRHLLYISMIVDGTKPTTLQTLYDRFTSLIWMIGQDEISDPPLTFTPVPGNLLVPENLLCISQKHGLPEVPDTKENLGLLINWMRENLVYFVGGTQLHRLFVDVIRKLSASKAASVLRIEEKLKAARSGSYERMHELKSFLNIS